MLTKDNIATMNEAQLRKEVVIPLLQAMGYHDVYEYHGGSGEQGKDVVCWKTDDLGSRENIAIVAKATQMTGKAQNSRGTAGEVQTQIRQCFGSPFIDPVSSREQVVNRVWVVCSKKINKEAIDAITASVADLTLMRNVRFIDGDRLWELVQQYLPQSLWHSVEEVQRHISELDTHYEPRITIESGKTTIAIVEKFPGAAKEKPIVFKGTFLFPNKEDAEAFQHSYKRLVETGEPVDIASEFIGDIAPPEIIKTVLGTSNLNLTSVQILPSEVDTEISVQIQILCEDGDHFTLNNVVLRWTRGGTKEITLINDEQNIPFDVKFVIQIDSQMAHFDIRPRDIPFNAVQLLEILRLQTCLAKNAHIRVVNLEDGIAFFEVQHDKGTGKLPDAGYVAFVEKLATIQRMVKRRLIIPDREMTIDELHLIDELYCAVTNGKFEGRWKNYSVRLDLTPDAFTGLIGDNDVAIEQQLGLEIIETVTLFEIEIPLGRVRQFLKTAKLQNMEEVRAQYLASPSGDVSIELKFTPGSDATFVRQYLDWLPKDTGPSVTG